MSAERASRSLRTQGRGLYGHDTPHVDTVAVPTHSQEKPRLGTTTKCQSWNSQCTRLTSQGLASATATLSAGRTLTLLPFLPAATAAPAPGVSPHQLS